MPKERSEPGRRASSAGGPWVQAVLQGALDIAGSDHVFGILPRALLRLGQALGADRLLIFENDPDPGGAVRLLQAWDSRPAPEPRARTEAARPAGGYAWPSGLGEGRAAVVSARTAKGRLAEQLNEAHAGAMIFAPMVAGERWWGTLRLDAPEGARDWSREEIEGVAAFARAVGAAILRERRETGRRRGEQALRTYGRRDPLTGLVGRDLFRERLERAIADAQDGRGRFAVHYLDLDHFKDVNDTMGHPMGDLLLRAVAERLRRAARPTDVVARFGGDEFAILQFDVGDTDDAGALARAVLEAIAAPIEVRRRELHVSGSLGIAVYEADGADAESMLAHAELALYRAKADGRRTYRFFTSAMDAEARRRVSLADELRQALNRGEFYLLYQPQVRAATGAISGVEALLRWRHPTRGVVSPADFIPEAEENGLIRPLGEWVLRAACWQQKAWIEAGLEPPPMSVNVSAAQFHDASGLETFLDRLTRDTRVPAALLQLELTETTLMEVSMDQAEVLDRLHLKGFKIALDDFGTGYSSLEYLRRYRVDQLKIAQVFVADMLDRNGDAAIVRAAISLALALDLRVVAEGVEKPEQVAVLKDWGCGEIQGFYFSPPAPPEVVEQMLRARVVRPAAPPTSSAQPAAETTRA